ncbi:MAG TPA: FeoB-associated Cys-rich membrane protein [Urbifossiella sp.]
MQLAATIAIVFLAAAYILRALWRTLSGKKSGCGSGCGKCAAPADSEPNGRIPLL